MVSYIVLDEQTANELGILESDRIIGELGLVNVFVGKNNSGKSRLLRKLFEKANVDRRNSREHDTSFISNEMAVLSENPRLKNYLSGRISNALKKGMQNASEYQKIYKHLNEIFSETDLTISFFKRHGYNSFNEFLQQYNIDQIDKDTVKNSLEETFERLIINIGRINSEKQFKTLYIPILRGLRPLQFLTDRKFDNTDVFTARTNFDYFNPSMKYNLFSGLTIYEDIKKLLLGTEADRQIIAEFETFLSDYIFDEKITLIPRYNEDVLNIKIGQKPQLPVFQLGDGLQTIITILFPIFIKKDQKRLVFIEEPETHLHPEWQRKLLQALKWIPNQQYFITTHSNAFINDEQTRLYSVKKEEEVFRVQEAILESDKLSIFRELGYKQSDLLQANYILWVEGYSDKVYLEYWINQLSPELKEGEHYTVMFYGGANFKYLINEGNFRFIRNINQNFGIILDSDRKNKTEVLNKEKRIVQELFEKEGLFCWVTKRRELENYTNYEQFVEAVEKVHSLIDITIGEDDFDDRNTVVDNKAKVQHKSTIKLPSELFGKVQKNKTDPLKNVSDQELRQAIESAIKDTANTTFRVDKIRVAQAYTTLNLPELEGELQNQLKLLIEKIKMANAISRNNTLED